MCAIRVFSSMAIGARTSAASPKRVDLQSVYKLLVWCLKGTKHKRGRLRVAAGDMGSVCLVAFMRTVGSLVTGRDRKRIQ